VGGGAINPDGTVACVATARDDEGLGLTVWRSTGDLGESWEPVWLPDDLARASDRTLVFDTQNDVFRVLAWDRDTGELVLGTSPACDTEWAASSLGLTVEDMPSYLVGPDRDGQIHHELLFVDSAQALVRYVSSTGDPGSFEPALVEAPPFPVVLRPPTNPDLVAFGVFDRFHRFMRVGTDLVLLAGPYGDGGAVHLYVQLADAWAEIGEPALPGSGRPATFDRWRVTRAAAALFPDEDPLDVSRDAGLLLVYSGVGDNACQIDVLCAEPGGAAEMYFRAQPAP